MYISSAGSHRGLLIAIRGIDMTEKTKNSGSKTGSRAFQQTPIKHRRIVIANVGLLFLDGKHKLDWKWGHVVSYVTHQYSRVDFYSSLEVNLSLYYGGVVLLWV